MEKEFARLYEGIGLGLTTWSPLASGVLSGKYSSGVPSDSRLALPGYEWLRERFPEAVLKGAGALEPIAKELGATSAQLALAWCVRNPRVSTVITGASSVAQVKENMAALDIVPKLDEGIVRRMEEAPPPSRRSSASPSSVTGSARLPLRRVVRVDRSHLATRFYRSHGPAIRSSRKP